MMRVTQCTDVEQLTSQASQFCIDVLQRALRAQNEVSAQNEVTLLLSGGSTPLPLYRALATAEVDWSRVVIALVDERWVDVHSEASNERSVREALAAVIGPARFVGMKTSHVYARDAQAEVDARYRALPPVALAVLGMGVDGHVASWFAGAEGLHAALFEQGSCVAIRAQASAVTGAYVERMTVTRHLLAQSQQMLLLINGADKWKTFSSAQRSGVDCQSTPVAALFEFAAPLQVFAVPC